MEKNRFDDYGEADGQGQYGDPIAETKEEAIKLASTFPEKSQMDKLADSGHIYLLKQAMLGVKNPVVKETVNEVDWCEVLL